MRLTTIIAGLIVSTISVAAEAKDYTCHGPGRCVCTQTMAAKSVLGYGATNDQQSVNVNITCINMDTMSVAYYTERKEDGVGGTYATDPTPPGQ